MKKYLICIITSILLFSCLGMTAFADETASTISDDYQTVYLNGKTYSRFNASLIETEYDTYDVTPELTDAQQENITNISIMANESESLLSVDIDFKDGSTLSANFMRDDYRKNYDELIKNPNTPYIIDFEWPEGNQVTGSKSLFTANPVVLAQRSLNRSASYHVLMNIIEDDTRIYKGSLLIVDDHYYYVDYEEIGVTNPYFFLPYEYTELPAYEITDPDLVAEIIAGEDAYYDDDFGFFYDDDLTKTISTVFLILIFAVVPAVILILFLILAIRTKTIYRKLFAAICGCAGLELVIFAIVAMIFYMG